tara:strand:- start:160 stop:1215 length:1056 start_codon:yes stop_codon:yes gene_type:complete
LTIRSTIFDLETNALDGKAIRKQIAIEATSGEEHLRMNLLLYLPISAQERPVPVMLILNFGGNHTIHSDPAIAITTGYLREEYRPAEEFRGKREERYPIEELLARGYGIATANYGDIDPDFHDGFENGIHPLFNTPNERSEESWGAVGAWAWGLSRFMDYLETDDDVDSSRVAVLGHSRLGKAALWAGAQDERFAIVISNNSGCTGASISRHREGESVTEINRNFPHWFCENYRQYNDKESTLPVDQHMLISLMAPRPVYVASADLDLWADPEGEFLSCVHAEPVYKLFGVDGMQTEKMPVPNQPINEGHIGYHCRQGEHDLTRFDWICYMDFADRHWKTGQIENGEAPSN